MVMEGLAAGWGEQENLANGVDDFKHCSSFLWRIRVGCQFFLSSRPGVGFTVKRPSLHLPQDPP
jgi:hypothetical protein